MSRFVLTRYEPKIAEWVMSDIGELNSPLTANGGSRSTRVDPKLFGEPSGISGDTDGSGVTSSGHFVTGLVSSTTQLRNGWVRQRVRLGSLGKRSRIAENGVQEL